MEESVRRQECPYVVSFRLSNMYSYNEEPTVEREKEENLIERKEHMHVLNNVLLQCPFPCKLTKGHWLTVTHSL